MKLVKVAIGLVGHTAVRVGRAFAAGPVPPILHQTDPATLALKEKTLSHDAICLRAMETALANAEERKNFTVRGWFKDLLRDIWRWATGRKMA
jgi:hypothetical protein